MNLLESVIYILNETITVINCVFIATLLFDFKVNLKLRHVFIVLLFLLTCIFINDQLIRLIIGIVYEFCMFITIIDRRKKTFLIFLICILLEMFIQIVIELLLSANLSHQLIHVFYSKMTILLIVMILSIVKNIYFKENNNDQTITFFPSFNLIINAIFATCPLLVIRSFDFNIDFVMIEYIILFCTVVVISNVLSYLFYCTHIKRNIEFQIELASKEKLLAMQKQYTDEVIANYENLRLFKHDINAKLGAFDYLIANNKCRELEDLSCSLKKELSNSQLYSVDIYIAATINQFIEVMQLHKIDFEFVDHLTKPLDMEGVHICTLLYNLLKNAIEATVQCDENKKIKLFIREYHHTLIIEIENSVDDNFSIKNIQNKTTTKIDRASHGFGLISIDEIINTYHGKIDYSYENNEVKIIIFLLNVV